MEIIFIWFNGKIMSYYYILIFFPALYVHFYLLTVLVYLVYKKVMYYFVSDRLFRQNLWRFRAFKILQLTTTVYFDCYKIHSEPQHISLVLGN